MTQNFFAQYLTKENLINIVKDLPLELLMDVVKNNSHFESQKIYMYREKDLLPPIQKEKDSLPSIQKEILYQKKIKLSERLPQKRDLVALEIKYIEDLSLFYIDSIIKKFYPFILKIQSQYSIHELNDNINFTSDLYGLYSHNELAILFDNISFNFLLHSGIRYTNNVREITHINKNKAFEFVFYNSLEERWINYNNQKRFVVRIENINFYKLFILDLINKDIIPDHIITMTTKPFNELLR